MPELSFGLLSPGAQPPSPPCLCGGTESRSACASLAPPSPPRPSAPRARALGTWCLRHSRCFSSGRSFPGCSPSSHTSEKVTLKQKRQVRTGGSEIVPDRASVQRHHLVPSPCPPPHFRQLRTPVRGTFLCKYFSQGRSPGCYLHLPRGGYCED